jgi:hypothetical protein
MMPRDTALGAERVAVAEQWSGDGQPRVRADHDHPLDAGNSSQLSYERRNGRGILRPGQHVRFRGAAPPGEVLGVLRGDGDHGHGGDEQSEHQAADSAEGGPGVVGEAAAVASNRDAV